jgi:hypothetical protein
MTNLNTLFEGVADVEDVDISDVSKTIANDGWAHLDEQTYNSSPIEKLSMKNGYHYLNVDPYGENRNRAYLKLELNTASLAFKAAADQSYSQSYKANNVDGGKKRYFEPMPDSITETQAFKNMVMKNVAMMFALYDFMKEDITIGLHAVRYVAEHGKPSYSSPVWLHRDDEPLVFVNVIDESANLIGGDSIIAENIKTINRVTHLQPFEGMMLTKECFHAVTPMEAPVGTRGHRDILLTTVEEADSVVKLKPQFQVPSKFPMMLP